MKSMTKLRASLALAGSILLGVDSARAQTITFDGANKNNGDNWNVATNWDTDTIPSGAVNVVIPANRQVTGNVSTTPSYTGNLTLQSGALLQSGYGDSNIGIHKVIGTAGSTTIYMGAGSRIAFRGNHTVAVPAIVLQGNAEITMGSSTAGGTDPVFGHGISGAYRLTLNGKSDCIATLSAANSFAELIATPQYGTAFDINATVAGSLGGNVTILANATNGTTGADLTVSAVNAMSDTATLTLYGTSGKLATFNANDTIGALKLNGVKQLAGSYTNTASWLNGSGTVTVAAPTGGAYWNVNSNANLGATQDATGIVFGAGNLTVAESDLRLIDDAVISVNSGSLATISSNITQDASPRQLHKVGAGTLRLSGSNNSFTGALAIGAGTVSVATLANANVASPIGQFASAGAAGLLLGGGTFQYTGGTTTTNRGFTLSGNSGIDVSAAGTTLTMGAVETYGVLGTLTASGGAGSALALGNVRIVEGQAITLNPTTISMTVASVEGYSSYPVVSSSTVTLGGISYGNVVTGAIIATNPPGSPFGLAINLVKSGTGDWTLSGAGNNSGTTTINGGKLILDYHTSNVSKLTNGSALTLGGGTLELKGATGNHVEIVSATTLNAGGSFIIRNDVNTAKLLMNAITRNAGSTISFADATIAATDTLNTNSILGGYATLGADWARNSTGAGDGTITALSTYDTWTNSGGLTTANYLLSGADSLGGALLANTVKIANTGNNQTLDLGANNLTITTTSATALGGILYAGGSDNIYSITGTGRLLASTTTGELIVNTHTGNLTIDAPIVTSGATAGLLTKSGQGKLVVNSNNAFTGAVRVNEGVLRIGHANATGSNAGGITVQNGASLELSNDITVVSDALALTGTGISNGGALRNVSGINTYTGAITIGSGGARINADVNTTLNIVGVVTSAGNDVIFGGAGAINQNTTAISGAGGLLKDGGGILTLSLANTYGGGTTVSGGKLLINGSTSSTSLVTVNTGATLGGTGVIGGNVILNSGGTLSPGASIESLATGSNSWNGGSTLVFEFSTDGSTGTAGSQWDLLTITGALDLTGASNMNPINLNLVTMLDVTNAGLLPSWDPNADAIWSGFVTTTEGITGFSASLFDIDTSGFQNSLNLNGSFSITQNVNNLDLVYTVIPEPRAVLICGLGLLLLLLRRR